MDTFIGRSRDTEKSVEKIYDNKNLQEGNAHKLAMF